MDAILYFGRMHGWSLVLSASRYNRENQNQNQGQGTEGRIGVEGRGQRGVPGDPFLSRPQVPQLPPQLSPQLPPPGFINNPAVAIPGGPQEEYGPPQGPVPADGPGNFVPPPGPLPDFPGDLDSQAPFPGSYYPQQGPFGGNFYPQQSPQGPLPTNFNPQGPISVPGDFNTQGATGTIPGIPGSYAPQNPSEYGTQFFNRALQNR